MALTNLVGQIDEEIARLQKIRTMLLDDAGPSIVPRVKTRHMSAAARKRIAAAQKARWEKVRQSKKS